jgi:phosphoribosylamine--glycine ligase
MNVVVIGSGGREHALALKIKESSKLDNLFIVPGNPGTSALGENIEIDLSDPLKIVNFCKSTFIDLVVIGPEQPLVDGLADVLRKNDIKVFGPGKNAAEIEASKSFAKKIMNEAGVPTAGYFELTSDQISSDENVIKKSKYPFVIKADGLAAGKGVFICQTPEDASQAIKIICIDKAFGTAGNTIVIEEFLEGEEASVFAICDGSDFICLPASQDHKRIGENDTGKNTGGMGAYAPAPIVTPEILEKIKKKIFTPVLQTLKEKNAEFIGCLYAGLMIIDNEPKVVEFNCRFGDPETQVVMPVLKGDFLQLLYSAASGKLDKDSVSYNGGCSVCVVAASEGYPDVYKKDFEISGLNNLPHDITVHHAGTKLVNGKILTNGGRVLGLTSFIPEYNLQLAREKAYEAINKINFQNIYFRKDIALKAIH